MMNRSTPGFSQAAPTNSPGEITQLLRSWGEGSREAEEQLFAIVFPNLRRLARYFMSRERPGHTLQATELIGQTYLRLVSARERNWQSRSQFFAIAGRVMRRHLIDYARQRPRGEHIDVGGIDNLLPTNPAKIDEALTVDRLLDHLAEQHPDLCRVVEVKYFLGLTDDEAAEALGMKVRTMQRLWQDARQWLFERMAPAHATTAAE